MTILRQDATFALIIYFKGKHSVPRNNNGRETTGLQTYRDNNAGYRGKWFYFSTFPDPVNMASHGLFWRPDDFSGLECRFVRTT